DFAAPERLGAGEVQHLVRRDLGVGVGLGSVARDRRVGGGGPVADGVFGLTGGKRKRASRDERRGGRSHARLNRPCGDWFPAERACKGRVDFAGASSTEAPCVLRGSVSANGRRAS